MAMLDWLMVLCQLKDVWKCVTVKHGEQFAIPCGIILTLQLFAGN